MTSSHTVLNLATAYRDVTLVRHEESTGAVVERLTFTGRVLGDATSEQTTHRGHDGRDYAPKNVKCSACRWLEVTIWSRRNGDPNVDDQFTYDYVVHTLGVSEVPGEVDYVRLWQTASAFEVVELLTVRRQRGSKTETFIPPQHARALAQASSLDEGIREAYINRAVA